MKYLRRLYENKKKHEYGCAMLYIKMPFLQVLHEIIDEQDLYIENDTNSHGLEDEPHITLLYGLHDSNSASEILEMCYDFLFSVKELDLFNVSSFDNDKFDVLKFDVKGAQNLHIVNKELVKFPHTNKFPEYHPHCTIAYLKPRKAKKYIKLLSRIQVNVEVEKLVYSNSDGQKIEKIMDV